MPLPVPQIVTFPLVQGLSERTDPRVMDPPYLSELENGMFSKAGRLEKRYGYTSLGTSTLSGVATTGSLGISRRLFSLENKLYQVARNTGINSDSFAPRLHGYSAETGQWHIDYNTLSPVTAQRDPVCLVPSSIATPKSVDVATHNGMFFYVYTSGSVVWLTIKSKTGAVILANQVVANVGVAQYAGRCLVVDSKLVVAWSENPAVGPPLVRAVSIGLTGTDFTPSAITNLANLSAYHTNGQGWEICAVTPVGGGAPTQFVLASLGANTWEMRLDRFTGALATVATNAAITVGGAGDQVTTFGLVASDAVGATSWVAAGLDIGATSIVKMVPFTASSLVAGAVITNAITGSSEIYERLGVVTIDNSDAIVVATPTDSALNYISVAEVRVAAGITLAQRDYFHWVLASRPFRLGSTGSYAVLAAHMLSTNTWTAGEEVNWTYSLIDLSRSSNLNQFPIEIARVAPRQAAPLYFGIDKYVLPNVANYDTDFYVTPIVTGDITGSSSVTDFAGKFTIAGAHFAVTSIVTATTAGPVRSAYYDGLATNNCQATTIGNISAITGGVPTYGDGVRAVEAGFPYYPVGVTGSPNAAGGTIPDGEYYYAVVYSQYDAAGNIHESFPAATAKVTATGGGTSVVNLTIPRLLMSRRTSALLSGFNTVRADVYRTTNKGSTFYKLGSAAVSGSGTRTLAFQDTGSVSDASLEASPKIYTHGGVLGNLCPPSATIAVTYNKRVWLAGCDDRRQIWFSKILEAGVAPGFNDDLVLFLDEPITALHPMDGVMFAFSRTGIWRIVGDGPANNGAGSSLENPVRLPGNVGCVDPRSVVAAPQGLYFQSEAGLYLLDRGHTVREVAFASDKLASYPVISSAVLQEDLNQIRWTCATAENSNTGIMIVYDYLNDLWMTHTFAGYERGLVGACNHNGSYKWLDNVGTVHVENPSSWLDTTFAGSEYWTTLMFETAEIKLSGLLGFQRAWRAMLLCERLTAASLRIKVWNDYNTGTADQDASITEANITTGGAASQPSVYLKRQRCTSVRVRVQDVAPASFGTGRGLAFQAIAFEVGAEPGLKRNRQELKK